MAILNVNPTRMELTRLKRRLAVARRGHKLLKDKRDELMKRFLELVKKNKELREKTEEMIMNIHSHFLAARSVIPPEALDEALMFPKQAFSLDIAFTNIMSVNVPDFTFRTKSDKKEDTFPYGFSDTSSELDNAITILYQAIPYLFELSQIEKRVELLADEIEKTRRRVNALEYILIPQLTDTIKYIKMKLDENERGNLTRLMKVKDMMIDNARKAVKFIIPILLTSFIISGCSIFRKKGEVLLSPLETPPQVKYNIVEVKKGSIKKEIKDTVSIEVSAGTSIYSKYGGRLKGFYVRDGDIIRKGDLLAELDTDSVEIKLKQCEISVEKAKKNREQAIAQVERDIELARMHLENLKNELKEKEALRELVSIEGNSALKSYEEDISNINYSIIKQEAEIEGLYDRLKATKITGDMDVNNAEHNLNRVRKELEGMKVISSVEGIAFNVGKFTLGEQVGAYSPMLTIIKPEDIQLKCTGLNARHFEVGMKVEIFVDDITLEGKVAVSPAYLPENAPSSIKDAIIINIEGLTTEMMTNRKGNIRINLVLEERDDVIVVPKRVLQNYKGNKYVYVLKDGEKKQRFVEIGIETNQEAEIVKGLEVGELIIDA
jgi:V/A-type H+-transporting ATPase subunit D